MDARIPLPHRLAWLSGSLVGLLAVAALGCAADADEAALARRIQAALADAARRTGIDVAALTVSSAERVTWLDGSLGCPEPDMMYTQALVSGYRIRIEAGGETLDYHAGTRGAPLLCPPAHAR